MTAISPGDAFLIPVYSGGHAFGAVQAVNAERGIAVVVLQAGHCGEAPLAVVSAGKALLRQYAEQVL